MKRALEYLKGADSELDKVFLVYKLMETPVTMMQEGLEGMEIEECKKYFRRLVK
jgi:hypothetical protein